MGKKVNMMEDLSFMDYEDPKLTRIDKTTKFVIENSSGQVKFIFRKKKENDIIKALIKKGIPLSQLRKNKYGDILIM